MSTIHLAFSVETESGNDVGSAYVERSKISIASLLIWAPGSHDLEGWNCFLRPGDGPYATYGYLRLADDPMLQFALRQFNASLYFITFRAKHHPSPNSTPVIFTPHIPRCGTPASTPALKRKSKATPVDPDIIASAALPERKDRQSESQNDGDPFSLEELDDPANRRIIFKDGDTVIAVDGEHLLEFVKSKAAAGTALNDIVLECDYGSIQLTTDVWTTALLRNNNFTADFIQLFIGMCSNFKKYPDALKHLHQSPLWMKIKLYLSDLLRFGSDEGARDRLETDFNAKFYLTNAYFTTDEAQLILNFPSGSGLTFEQLLEVLMKKKVDQSKAGTSKDFYLCTSHDLAPVVKDVFGIRKGFDEEKAFVIASKAFQKEWKAKMKRNK
ncbi:hypothetical protein BC832DRAFT_592565 [Gaertneriomyces semiglobifer]|nr:hypothetical protein BC832DRAFT_592565 [Gaertneriomyces semiglobifer]